MSAILKRLGGRNNVETLLEKARQGGFNWVVVEGDNLVLKRELILTDSPIIPHNYIHLNKVQKAFDTGRHKKLTLTALVSQFGQSFANEIIRNNPDPDYYTHYDIQLKRYLKKNGHKDTEFGEYFVEKMPIQDVLEYGVVRERRIAMHGKDIMEIQKIKQYLERKNLIE